MILKPIKTHQIPLNPIKTHKIPLKPIKSHMFFHGKLLPEELQAHQIAQCHGSHGHAKGRGGLGRKTAAASDEKMGEITMENMRKRWEKNYGTYSGLMGFIGDLMGFIVNQWDINGIYQYPKWIHGAGIFTY